MYEPLKYVPQTSRSWRMQEPADDKMTWKDYLADAAQVALFLAAGFCLGFLVGAVKIMGGV